MSAIRRHPLFLPLLAGLLLRLGAACLGSGYLMHDDHFLVLEVAASWADGEDYNEWLPWSQTGTPEVKPGNFAYPLTQFLLFEIFERTGPEHPSQQALVLRILHALYSCSIIVLGYLLARSLRPEDEKGAGTVAWILAAGGLWPLLSVHQLVEMVCIPPLMLGLLHLVREKSLTFRNMLIAGLGIGLATGLRYQCGLIGIGLVPVLMMQRQLKALIIIGCTALLAFSLTQLPDAWAWGEPFAQLRGYIQYNSTHAAEYPQGPWFQYILTLMVALVPPVSLMMLWGMFHRGNPVPARWWRVLLPILVFFAFHSFFANKQERFILPILPAIIVLGTLGWNDWTGCSAWWKRHLRLEKAGWQLFWVLSTAVVAATLTYPGKHSRVAAMEFLYDNGSPYFALVEVDSGAMPPRFYSGSWEEYHIDNRRVEQADPLTTVRRWCGTPPEYILFQGDQHLGEAVAAYKSALPELRYVTTIQPSRIDRWLHALNPINSVERIMIYSTRDALPCP